MEYFLGVIGVCLIMILMGSLVELGGVVVKYFLQKKEINKSIPTPVIYRMRPQINEAVIELISNYTSLIDSYEIDQSNERIKLNIKIKKDLYSSNDVYESMSNQEKINE